MSEKKEKKHININIMENILKITAIKSNGNLYKSRFGKDDKDLERRVPKEDLEYGNEWYLHGELEKKIGFDRGFITNLTSFGHCERYLNKCYLVNSIGRHETLDKNKVCFNRLKLNGIVPVDVEGIRERCLGFFWTVDEERFDFLYDGRQNWTKWDQKGLIILESDIEAFDCCYSLYFSKSCFI